MADCLRIYTWTFIAILVVNMVLSSSIVKRDTVEIEQNLDPVLQEELNEDAFGGDAGDRGDREKRLGVIKTIGLKAVLLNLIFGKIDSFIDAKTRAINQLDKQNIIKNQKYFGITPPPKRPPSQGKPSGPKPIDFPVNTAVSLQIPDRLYGNSFSLVTNVSKIIGDVLFNTADRAQELADRVNAKLRRKFGFARKIIDIGIGPESGGSSSSSSSSSSASASSSSSSSSSSDDDYVDPEAATASPNNGNGGSNNNNKEDEDINGTR